MARLAEDKITITISRLYKNNEVVEELLSEGKVLEIEAVMNELFGKDFVVEVEKE